MIPAIPSEEERRQLIRQGMTWALRWLQMAAPGCTVIYHEGWLMTDRLTNPELDAIASAFLEAADHKLVELKQRRIGDMQMEYIAQRRASE